MTTCPNCQILTDRLAEAEDYAALLRDARRRDMREIDRLRAACNAAPATQPEDGETRPC